MTGAVSSPASTPIVFTAAGGPCFGWYHPARAPARGAGVVLCPGMGWEAICGYRTFLQFAHALVESGFDVLRFDYHGTGESAGGDTDPGRVAAWEDSIAQACSNLRRLAGVPRMALLGLRLGGTLAADAAIRLGGVDALVMWAPPASGRAYSRELKAGASAVGMQPAQPSRDLVAMGSLYTAETLAAMQALNFDAAARAPAPAVLIIERDDFPSSGALAARFRALGAQVTEQGWPGYAAMMVEPHKAELDPLLPARIVQWLSEALPPDGPNVRFEAPAPVGFVTEGVRESAVRFGSDGSLFGMLAQPAAATGSQQAVGVILVNVAGNYRIGPNRIYVKLSRALASAGFQALRFDLPGIGDSCFDVGLSARSLYNQDSTPDVRAAVDVLVERGCRQVWVLGICSGSYVAFNAALADPRIAGQVLMNPRLLEWSQGSGDWEAAMSSAAYKSTTYYRRKLRMPEVYLRLLRGKIDVKGISSRIAILIGARLRRTFKRMLGRSPVEGVLPKMKLLGSRGVDTLMIMSAQDDGLDYVEFHLGSGASEMRGDPHFRFEIVEDSDHTFSSLASQRHVIDTVIAHLARASGAPAGSAGCVR
ncbi:MAG: alpha/beta fold hydrolase [Pseudomonadota bacterium]